MCGICGVYEYGFENKKIELKVLEKMCRVIEHRGPDDEGFFVSGNIGLGMKRLSIIDLKGGHQPIFNEDKTIALVFNGEIYNYRQLKEMLEEKGHIFSTNSDTETIVHLYEERGERCVESLRGMFSFALWDAREEKLLLARDRLGIKPLFYYIARGRVLFGSEIKCILQDAQLERELNFSGLDKYLSFSYIPAPETIFAGIKKMLPATILVCQKGDIRQEEYWRLNYNSLPEKDERYYADKVLELLKESVRIRLISEVPLGAFLSGGIDSSTVVALMHMVSGSRVNTFSIGYDGKGEELFNELCYARIVASRFQTKHHEFMVKPELPELIPRLIGSFDEPFADAAAVPSYFVSKMAKEQVTVALSGLGGDEMFAGYPRYPGFLLARKYARLPRIIRRDIIGRILARLPESRNGGDYIRRIKKFANGIDFPVEERYLNFMATFNQRDKAELYSPLMRQMTDAAAAQELVRKFFFNHEEKSDLNKLLFADLKMYLPEDILALTDRISMLHSLEVRVPFLDHKLVEFCARIPPELKLKLFNSKYILKKAISPFMPGEVIKRRKRGFISPLALWLRRELKQYTLEVLSKDRVSKRGYFNWEKVAALLHKHFSGQESCHRQIWTLLIFELWHQLYLD